MPVLALVPELESWLCEVDDFGYTVLERYGHMNEEGKRVVLYL